MHRIKKHSLDSQLFECWKAAGQHLNNQVPGGINSWLNAQFGNPSPEHFSFRLGNQLFFVRLSIIDDGLDFPGSGHLVQELADDANGWALGMPMKSCRDGWVPAHPGWGTLRLGVGEPINPVELVSAEQIEMSDWELHHFAVQIVSDQLAQSGKKVRSTQGHMAIDPSVWVEGPDGSEWVVVRATRFPISEAERPEQLSELFDELRQSSCRGYFASVSVANADQTPGDQSPALPLLRGHGMNVRFTGFQEL